MSQPNSNRNPFSAGTLLTQGADFKDGTTGTPKQPPPADIHDVHRDVRLPAVSSGGGAGKPPEPDWTQLLDPGLPFYGDQRIEGLYRMVFGNPYVFRAYYEPRVIPGLVPTVQGCSTKVPPMFKPMDLTLRAAQQAAHVHLVKPHERALVHLAAIVSQCGLLLQTNMRDEEGQPQATTWDAISFTRFYLLSRPLIKIKAQHIEMGNTLAAVLSQSHNSEDVDRDQVMRLATAVKLCDTKLASYWSGQITAHLHG